MNTYTVTFVRELDEDTLDTDTVNVDSDVDADDLAAGDWDAHELLTGEARRQGLLDDEWEAVHVTLPNGEVVTVPAGL